MQLFRESLPIYEKKFEIQSALREHSTIIVTGETACGKTTQIPQYVMETFVKTKGKICCTQPRRVATISVAKRVAQEQQCSIGDKVGYAVRFDQQFSNHTKLKYMSDGMLLREALLDPLVRRYHTILLDEVHERSVNTDILCGILKSAQYKRRNTSRPLRIVLMSATMDSSVFQRFFYPNKVPLIESKGRLFQVSINHLICDNPDDIDYQHKSIVTLVKIHREYPLDHGVLIFLTGQEEIDSYIKHLNSIKDQFMLDVGKELEITPMYANLSRSPSFKTHKKDCRKVIVATNVAESSITIPGIKIVIDSGWVKRKRFNPFIEVDSLKHEMISQAEAWQRTGRAGREEIGYCYRLYTEEQFESMNKNVEPELLRINLTSVCLQLIAMGFGDVNSFDFLEKPNQVLIQRALRELQLLGCIEENDQNWKLSKLGKKMVKFPLEPSLSKCLITAQQLECLPSMINLVSLLSVDSILVYSNEKSTKELEIFAHPLGDHFTFLNIYNAFEKSNEHQQIGWCKRHCLNYRNLKQASSIAKQLEELIFKDNSTSYKETEDLENALMYEHNFLFICDLVNAYVLVLSYI